MALGGLRPASKVSNRSAADLSSIYIGSGLHSPLIRRQPRRRCSWHSLPLALSFRGFHAQRHQPASKLPASDQWVQDSFTSVAVSVSLKLTSLFIRLASIVCVQLSKDAAWIQQAACSLRSHAGSFSRLPGLQWGSRPFLHHNEKQQQRHHEKRHEENKQQHPIVAAQASTTLSMLQQHCPDMELIRVIKTLGDSNIPLDTKWLEFSQRLASHGHHAISESMKRLFAAAGESSGAVQALLSPEQQSKELWKSARTQSVIQREQAFKQMVFNQLLLTG